TAARVCKDGIIGCPDTNNFPPGEQPGLNYQWTFAGTNIPGATSTSFTIQHVQASNVGIYTVRASTGFQTNESQDAVLQLNSLGSEVQNVQAFDKVEDALAAPAFQLGFVPGSFGPGGPSVADRPDPDIVSVVQGVTGQQVNSTTTSGSGFGELIDGLLCGKSTCFNLVAVKPGVLLLNTDGTLFDTVMEVRRYLPGGSFVTLAKDDNSGSNGLASALSVPIEAGATNVIFVGGKNGASGTVILNC